MEILGQPAPPELELFWLDRNRSNSNFLADRNRSNNSAKKQGKSHGERDTGAAAGQGRCDIQWRVSPGATDRAVARANSEAELRIGEHAKRVGLGRRAFLQSLCGAATTFLTLNDAFAAIGNTGGLFRLPKESAFETAAAAEALAGDEFIFDVQTHMVDPTGAWRSSAGKYWEQILANFPQGSCGDEDPVDCFSAEKFIKHVFMDSDTDLAVLSFVPELPENNPLSLEEADRVRVLVDQMEGARAAVPPRHGDSECGPEIAPLQLMKDAVDRYPIAAWKCYTQWGPNRQRLRA